MGPIITAYVFSMASLFFGAVACLPAYGMQFVKKLVIAWALFFTAAYFTNMIVLVAVVVAYILSIKEQPPEAKLIYFVGLIPVIPLQTYIIPFPGIGYLWNLSYFRVVVVALFVPLYIQELSRPSRPGSVRSTDIYFFGFIILTAVITLRSGNLISVIRALLNVMVDFGIPYYVISRYLRNPQILNWMFSAFLFSAAVLALASVLESWRTWRFFSQMFFSLGLQFDPVALVPYSRDGVVRATGGTMFIALAYAYFAAVSCVVCFYMWKAKLLRFFPAGILMFLCVGGLILTDSKGGILATLCGIFVIYHTRLNPSFKFIVNIILLVVVPSVMGYLISTGFSTIDSEGSFAYRYQLVINSFDAIAENPILGAVDYVNHPSMQRSLQGEGIVDIVNVYLQVILEYGFVGLFLYVMTFASLIKGILKKPAIAGHDHKDILLALLVMTMLFIVTASSASFIPFYIVLIWAVSRAYLEFPEARNMPVEPSGAVNRA